ncbi:MAG: hypothetical protein GY773_19630 [Actinomycetia bacterium]|nr:hypothetical protein [Actinomycetes bacterium]
MSAEIINLDRFFLEPAAMPTYYSAHHGEWRPNFNHPDSVERHEMIGCCGAAVASEVVIIDGILALYYEELRSLMHLRCYVTIELDEMLARRTQRNLAAGYGGSAEDIAWYNRECVVPQHHQFNAPTRRFADLLVPNDTHATQDRDRIIEEVCISISQVLDARS